jgi:hypothetical protein
MGRLHSGIDFNFAAALNYGKDFTCGGIFNREPVFFALR